MVTALATAALICACLLLPHPSTAAARSAGCPSANLRPNASNAGAVDTATLCLIDRIRVAHGLRALRPNTELGRVAASQVSSMLHANYFADVRPSGQTPMSLVVDTRYQANAADISVGQNIAWGTSSLSTPAHVVAAWMASPPHREVMLDGEFHDAGVAAVSALPSVLHAGRRGGIYAVEFGVRR